MALIIASAFNTHLINNGIDMNFEEYIKELNKISNGNINMELLKIRDLLDKNECCIPHSFLYTYKILKTKKGSCVLKDVKILLNTYKEGTDYIVRHISYKTKKNKIVVNDEYYVHPNAFRKILMKNSTIDDYINYFIFLDNCIRYYTIYRNDFKIAINKDKYDTNTVTNINNMIYKIEEKLNNILDELGEII